MNADEIRALIANLSPAHILKRSSERYVDGFIQALLNIYPPNKIASVLQDKFSVPNEAKYSDDVYCRLACELTVANHIKLTGAPNFQAEKKIRPGAQTDVDAYCEVDGFKVATEVKTPELIFETYDSQNPVFQFAFAGRNPNFKEEFAKMKETVGDKMQLEMSKRRDLKLMNFLTETQAKLPKPSGADQCNILFVALDDVHTMTEWDGYLYGTGGLFTKQSFHPIESFDQVDLVILSNLQSFHSIATEHHDWTLKDVYLVPRANLNTRANVSDIAVGKALGLFPHQLKAFHEFRRSVEGDATVQMVTSFFKLRDFALEGLSVADYRRYFPVKTARMSSLPDR
jgi:hypothetical protein